MHLSPIIVFTHLHLISSFTSVWQVVFAYHPVYLYAPKNRNHKSKQFSFFHVIAYAVDLFNSANL